MGFDTDTLRGMGFETAHRISCNYRFTCDRKVCPKQVIFQAGQKPGCYVEKYTGYEPPNEAWHGKSLQDLNKITYRDVFSFKESWIYLLILILIGLFIYYSSILIKLIILIK